MSSAESGSRTAGDLAMTSLLAYLPRGNMLSEQEWQKRHSFLQWVLFVHLPGLFLFGLALHHRPQTTVLTLVPPPGWSTARRLLWRCREGRSRPISISSS